MYLYIYIYTKRVVRDSSGVCVCVMCAHEANPRRSGIGIETSYARALSRGARPGPGGGCRAREKKPRPYDMTASA